MHKIKSWVRTHKYCLAGLYLFIFLAGFFALELAAPEPKYIIHSTLDDMIPFNEWFILPYIMWYVWIPAFLIFFMIKDRDAFLKLCFVMFGGATFCLIVYAVAPNGLDLREPITSTNICAAILKILRYIDPPVNVCPSIHVASMAAVLFAISGSREFKNSVPMKIFAWVITFAVSIATLFIKQHSVVDVVCGWLLTFVFSLVWKVFIGPKVENL